MNQRTADVLNRLEIIAKKFEMTVENALEILEGKHPLHKVVQVATPIAPTPVAAPAVDPTPPTQPITSTPVVASAEVATQAVAGSTASDALAEIEGENQAAAGAAV